MQGVIRAHNNTQTARDRQQEQLIILLYAVPNPTGYRKHAGTDPGTALMAVDTIRYDTMGYINLRPKADE